MSRRLRWSKLPRSSYQVRAYNIKHDYDVGHFLEAYRQLLQRAVDETWARIKWIEKHNGQGTRRIIPIIPKENSFKHHHLRNLLMEGWSYSKHYVDSAIKQAYSMLKSWRRSYLKGERGREKPVVKKQFVRIKETLYSLRGGKIKVSIKPYEEHLEFDISKAWFLTRARGVMGELILNEKYLTVTFRFKRKQETKGKIAWDCNEKSLDGFSPKTGWIRADLTTLFHIHRVYELKRKRLQQNASKKPSLRKVMERYSGRERNRSKDFIHKLTTSLAREFKGYIHGFEDLKKSGMLGPSKEHNRNVSKSNWRTIVTFMGYKARTILLNPKDSTRKCSRCGMVNAPKGALYECNCGLRISRQLNAAINLYLQMKGLSPSPKLFNELMKGRSGFTQTGEEVDEDSDEPERSPRLMNPKSYASLSKTT
jgi:putative transposase